jgi:hypothetical protein
MMFQSCSGISGRNCRNFFSRVGSKIPKRASCPQIVV